MSLRENGIALNIRPNTIEPTVKDIKSMTEPNAIRRRPSSTRARNGREQERRRWLEVFIYVRTAWRAALSRRPRWFIISSRLESIRVLLWIRII